MLRIVRRLLIWIRFLNKKAQIFTKNASGTARFCFDLLVGSFLDKNSG